MPRRRHWFHVSHDINSDPEVWLLTETFGDRGLRAWLEILSIADRNEGMVPIAQELLVRAFSIKLNTTKDKASRCLRWFEEHSWTIRDPDLRVRNHLNYNPKRDAKREQIESPPTPSPSPSPLHPSPKEDIAASPKGFAEFWQLYPKKKNKGTAEKAWDKIHPDSALTATIVTAVNRWRTHKDWLKQNGDFIPYPASWLNARGWEDEGIIFARQPKPANGQSKPEPPITEADREKGKKFLDEMIRDVAGKMDVSK